jgi:hypothetical protein
LLAEKVVMFWRRLWKKLKRIAGWTQTSWLGPGGRAVVFDDLVDEAYKPVLEYANWMAQQPGMVEQYRVGDFLRAALAYHHLPRPTDPDEYEDLVVAVMNIVTDPPYPAFGGPPPRRIDGLEKMSPGPDGWQ